MFHAKDGFYFERLPHGDIRIYMTRNDRAPTDPGVTILGETILSRSALASIFAFACARGYTAKTFHEAYEVLRTEPALCAVHLTEELDSGD